MSKANSIEKWEAVLRKEDGSWQQLGTGASPESSITAASLSDSDLDFVFYFPLEDPKHSVENDPADFIKTVNQVNGGRVQGFSRHQVEVSVQGDAEYGWRCPRECFCVSAIGDRRKCECFYCNNVRCWEVTCSPCNGIQP